MGDTMSETAVAKRDSRCGQPWAVAAQRAGDQTRKLARLGLLLAMAVGLQIFESQLPSLPIPGAKMGLANLVSLLIILLWGWREALLIVVTRQLLGSLATGTFLSTPFLFGLAGGVASVLTMSLAVFLFARAERQQLSTVGISLIGALTHNCTQLLVAWALTGVPAILGYLPLLLWFSLPAGALVGALAQVLWPRLSDLDRAAAPRADSVAQPPVPHSRPSPSRGAVGRWLQGLHLRPADLGIALLTILVASGLIMLRQATSVALPHPVAVVTVNGQERLRLSLDQERQLPLDVNGGRMVIETQVGKVRVLTSTCPDKICVQTGWISNPAQVIICVPYRTVVRVVGGSTTEYDVLSS